MSPDGTSSWQVKFIQMTDNGDILAGTGSGTGDAPNPRGVAKMRDEGTIATVSDWLSDLNGKRWTCEVDNNFNAERAQVAVSFE
jgi:hypothetical protein